MYIHAHAGSQPAKSNREAKSPLSEQDPATIMASITTGGSRRRKSSAGDAPSPKWMTEQSHVWIIDGESMAALWQYPSWWERCGEAAFRSWKSRNDKNHFYSLSSYPSSIKQNTPRKWALVTVKRDIWYQREIKEERCSQNKGAQTFFKVCINNSVLIIPPSSKSSLSPRIQ